MTCLLWPLLIICTLITVRAEFSHETRLLEPATVKKILHKCCPNNKILSNKAYDCVPHGNRKNFSDENVFNKERKVTALLSELFEISVDPDFEKNMKNGNTFFRHAFRINRQQKVFLYTDGTVDVETNSGNFSFDSTDYCLEYELHNTKAGLKPVPFFWVVDVKPLAKDDHVTSLSADYPIVAISGLLLSAFFLLLVLVVYWTLRELRTLGGLILMGCVASLMSVFILMAVFQILNLDGLTKSDGVCKGISFAIYFSALASFFWMNVMSFDIWSTFRGFIGTRPIHRKGKNFKFLVYCLYAWGVPALLTSAEAVLNEIDLRHGPITWLTTLKISSRKCFIEGNALFYYLFIPMLILLSTNCILFLKTGLIVRKLQRGAAMLDRDKKNSQKQHNFRFVVYLKLSMVMGVSWLLEVVSALAPAFKGFYVSDAYNIMTGLFIFVIFVCKPKIWRGLKKRFSQSAADSTRDRRSSETPFIRSSSASTSDSELSADDTQVRNTDVRIRTSVCFDPRGLDK